MIRNATTSSVLVVRPPMAGPVPLPASAPIPAAPLFDAGGPVRLYDANFDFYERFLFRSAKRPGPEEAAGLLGRLLADSPPPPEEAVRILRHLRAMLPAVSAPLAPTRIGWGWVCCPSLTGAAEVPAFVRDRRVNPFVDLAEKGLRRRLAETDPAAVIFSLTSSVQCPAALTLAAFCRAASPDLERVLIAPAGLCGEMAPFFDRTVAGPPPARQETPRLVRWQKNENGPGPAPEELKAAARDGCWNHLDITTGRSARAPSKPAAAGAPVHSFCHWEPAAWPPAGARQRWPEQVSGYPEAAPLPGAPLWCAVRDPDLFDIWLKEKPVPELSRWRFDIETGKAFQVGDGLDYRFAPPSELTADEMAELCRMVVAGGSVTARWVRHNLERAFLIGLAVEFGVIVANSSLKHPRQEYLEKVSRDAGIDLAGFLERGYTSVRPEYRGLGIGTRLLEGLTARAGGRKIFSIIGEDNIATQKIALKNRTRKVAVFYSRTLEKPVGVWMPEKLAEQYLKKGASE